MGLLGGSSEQTVLSNLKKVAASLKDTGGPVKAAPPPNDSTRGKDNLKAHAAFGLVRLGVSVVHVQPGTLRIGTWERRVYD